MPERLLNIPAILKRGVSDVASVFDAFGVGIYCVDFDGRFTYVNPSGQELLGWDAGELLGRNVHETIHHSHPDGSPYPLEECPLHRAIELGAAGQELDDLFWREDGLPLEVAQTIAPLYEDGERVGAIVVFIDVHERRRDSELLRRRAAQQSALVDAMVSFDMKNGASRKSATEGAGMAVEPGLHGAAGHSQPAGGLERAHPGLGGQQLDERGVQAVDRPVIAGSHAVQKYQGPFGINSQNDQ